MVGPGDDRAPLLEVADLRVRFPTARGTVNAVAGVSFEVRRGERVAVVGESGSGKSVTAMSMIGLVPHPGIVNGSIRFQGDEVVGMGERDLAGIRGRGIGLVPQDATAALSPLKTIGSQIEEGLRLHTGVSGAQAKEKTLELIRQVQIGDPEMRARQYGYEMSGGMAQRAMIAAAVGPEPDLLLADEPTSALDATTSLGILELLTDLGHRHGMAVVLITHDLGAVAQFAERVIVMYAGRIVEEAPVDRLFSHPRHPYTRGLLESVPGARGRRVNAIPGSVPDLIALPSGCVFHPRCFLSHGRERCRTEPPELRLQPGAVAQRSACHFAEELEPVTVEPLGPAAAASGEAEGGDLLAVETLSKTFVVKGGAFRRGGVVRAVDSASFTVRRGEVLALVGESGSGKSTTGKMILGLERPSDGRVVFDGQDITRSASRKKSLQRRLQVVFQNPDSSLDPRMKVEDIIAEPLKVHRLGDAAERRARVESLLEQVGLSRAHVGRYPFEFSGGQRQRIAIARALAPKPDLIVCDEPVTALDVSVQAQILNLLQDVQRSDRLSYLFVAHDLSVVRQIADRVAVMYLGQIVELAETEAFFAGPHHPYSVALLSAMSATDPETERSKERVVLPGTVPSPLDPPSGCRFHPRCWRAQSVCSEVVPESRQISAGRWAACHFPTNTDDGGSAVAVADPESSSRREASRGR